MESSRPPAPSERALPADRGAAAAARLEEAWTPAALEARGRAVVAQAEDLLGTLVRRPARGPDELLETVNDFSILVMSLRYECNLLKEVHPDPQLSETAERVLRDLAALETRFLQHAPLFDALRALDTTDLGAQELELVGRLSRDMRRAGVALDEPERQRARRLIDETVRLGQEFGRNIRNHVGMIELTGPSELDGLPDDYIRAHPPGPDGKIRISTDSSDRLPFMAYARSGEARRELLRAAHQRAVPRNLEVLSELLANRHELARLLGYRSWADYLTEELMVGSARAAWTFIDSAHALARGRARSELEQMLTSKRRDGIQATRITEWELDCYAERVKAEELGFDAREARPYFEYRNVLRAVLDLNSSLFGLTFRRVDAPVWHPAVEVFDADLEGRAAGRIFLDMHPRAGKFKGAACFAMRPGVRARQLPRVALACNFPDPAALSDGALLDHRDVVSLFHEFGHLMHHLVRVDIPWVRLVPIAENDFLEAPSQLLEEWMYDHSVLRRFAGHVESGEPIPERLVRKLRETRDFGRGVWVQRHLFLAAVALAYHDGDPGEIDTTRLFFDLAERYSPVELDPEGRAQASFVHLQAYSAAYYSYIWSLAIAKDLASAFTEGLMDVTRARRYRDVVLAAGGTKPAAELLRHFLGRPHSLDAFRGWLTS